MVAYPGFARRAVPIIGSPRLNTADLLLWHAELSAIEAATDARKGLAAALRMHELALRTPAWLAAPGPDRDNAAIEARIREQVEKGMKPQDFSAQLRAMIGHDISRRFGGEMAKAAAAVRARALIVIAAEDHMVNPAPARDYAQLGGFQLLELPGACVRAHGHRLRGEPSLHRRRRVPEIGIDSPRVGIYISKYIIEELC